MFGQRDDTSRPPALGEAVLTVLADAGFTGKHRVIAFRAVQGYVFGALQVEHLSPLSGMGTRALAALPAEELPVLSETAAWARTVAPEDEFRQGLRFSCTVSASQSNCSIGRLTDVQTRPGRFESIVVVV